MARKKVSPKRKGSSAGLVPVERIVRSIMLVRGQKVLLDSDLANLYGVSTGRLNEAVSRNLDRFPEDFMFRLSKPEFENLKSQFAISSQGHGGRRKLPRVFTEQGVAMLSGVLNSKRAVQVNIEIMRAFVRLRRLLATHKDLRRKIEELEAKYDQQFAIVFEAIRELMDESFEEKPKDRMGFQKAKPKVN